MDNLEHFKDYINDYLVQNEMNIFQFSKLVGIDDYIISCWIQGKHLPSVKHTITIADHFDVAIDYLLGIAEESNYTRSIMEQDFPTRLTQQLLKYNITPYRLSIECDIGRAAISKWLIMRQLPRLDNLITIAKFFDCSIDYLIGRSD